MRIADRFRYQFPFKSAIRNANPRLLQRPAEVLEAVQSLFDDVDTGGVTEPDGSIITEGSSGNHRDVGFTQ